MADDAAVSIPERVLSELKLRRAAARSTFRKVSIPERVLSELKPIGETTRFLILVVSIPERVLSELKLETIHRSERERLFQSLKGF